MKKRELLKEPIKHIDFTAFDSTSIIEGMAGMSFSARETANAAKIFAKMIEDPGCTIILCLAGSTSAGGCMKVYSDLVKLNMVDVVVATGAAIIDMDFFDAIGFNYYQGAGINDKRLREFYINRLYDTYIDEDDLQVCDIVIKEIADKIEPRAYSSREFLKYVGQYLKDNSVKKGSLIESAFDNNIPIFCPAFTDCSAGFGLVKHQWENPDKHVIIDSISDLRELVKVKIKAESTGLLVIGGGVPKNFALDTVPCAESLGEFTPKHKYAIQVTVADMRDGACSSATFEEASSWGKVDTKYTQMIYAEASSVIPILASYVYHNCDWKARIPKEWSKTF